MPFHEAARLAWIGRNYRLQYPDRWKDNSDEEIGRRVIQECLPIATDASNLLTEATVGYLQEVTLDSQIRTVELTQQLAEASVDSQVKVLQATTENTVAVTNLATKRELMPLSSDTLALEQARSALKVTEGKELEQNRLQAYAKEVEIDLNAAVAQKLITHETALGIHRRLQNLITDRAKLLALPVDSDTKKWLLENQDKVIDAFREDLNEQMARHLLKAGDGQDVEGTDA